MNDSDVLRNIRIPILYTFIEHIVFQGVEVHAKFAHLLPSQYAPLWSDRVLLPVIYIINNHYWFMLCLTIYYNFN